MTRPVRGCPAVTGLVLAVLAWAGAASADPEERRARTNYMLNCQGCHTPDGAGSADGEVPRMKGYVGNFLKAPGGREYLVRVPGAFDAPISDGELASLLNWMLVTIGAASTPADFRRYSEQEVAAIRSEPLVDVAGVRAKLMKKIPAPD